MPRRFLLLISVIAVSVTLATFAATLNLPFAGDDLAHLKTVGDIRSGQISALSGLMTPFNEQTIPVLRLFYLGATYLSGLDGAMTVRVMLALVHSVSAVLCGLIVYFHSRSRIGALVATVVFSGSAGFSGSVISAPACSIFLLGLSFVTVAVYGLTASPLRGWIRFAWSLLAFIIAGLSLNGALVFAVTLAILAFWSSDESSKRRWLMAAFFMFVGGASLLATRWNLHGAGLPLELDWTVVSKFLWIVYTAPLRFVCTWLPGLQNAMSRLIAEDNNKLVHLFAIGSVLIWLGNTRLLERNQRKLIFALLAGVLALTFLIAIGRAENSGLGLYITNRYYHFFLLPFAVEAGFVADSLATRFGNATSPRWRLIASCLVLGLAVFALYSSAINGWQWVHRPTYAIHGRAIASGKELVRLIEMEARSAKPPRRITLLDGEIPFAGILPNTIALRTLWFTEHPHGIKNVVFQTAGLSDEDVAVENKLLNHWAMLQKRDSSPVQVSRDRFVRQLPWQIDFRKDGFDNAMVYGFYGWDFDSRWLSAKGVVRLKPGSGDFIISGGVPAQVLNDTGRQTIGVVILMNNVELGRAQFTGAPEDRFRFSIPTELRNSIQNLEEVSVTLQADAVWTPRKLRLGLDERTLSVSVRTIGFETAPGPTPLTNP